VRLYDHLGQACRAVIAQERKINPDAPVEVRIPR
jgi:hypothetical protein